MEPDFTFIVVGVSLIMLASQIVLFVWDKWGNKSWSGLAKPITLMEVFRDWIAYVFIFCLLFLLVRGVFCWACSYCQHC